MGLQVTKQFYSKLSILIGAFLLVQLVMLYLKRDADFSSGACPQFDRSANDKVPHDRRRILSSVLEELATRERSEGFEKVYNEKIWGDGESASGDGSYMSYTVNVRKLIAQVFEMLKVKLFIDAPCGDCHWQPHIEGFDEVSYTGLDIVPSIISGDKEKYKDRPNMQFHRLDFSNHGFPFESDLILCRDMLQHNTLAAGYQAVVNIEASGAKYLITNWHHHEPSKDDTMWNKNVSPGDWYPIDVFLHPFNFSKPIAWIREGVDGVDRANKAVAVWKLPVLGLGKGERFSPKESDWEAAKKEIVFN